MSDTQPVSRSTVMATEANPESDRAGGSRGFGAELPTARAPATPSTLSTQVGTHGQRPALQNPSPHYHVGGVASRPSRPILCLERTAAAAAAAHLWCIRLSDCTRRRDQTTTGALGLLGLSFPEPRMGMGSPNGPRGRRVASLRTNVPSCHRRRYHHCHLLQLPRVTKTIRGR